MLSFFAGSLESLSGYFWFFALKFWEIVVIYELLFCLKLQVGLTMLGGGDTETQLDGKKSLTLSSLVGMQKRSDFP